ncbi:hypothetical protein XENTR_v10017680 [Xenopus tropicalis]|nr:hypothetical protein XENTR_v10017680 [Xenopus tropicalis]
MYPSAPQCPAPGTPDLLGNCVILLRSICPSVPPSVGTNTPEPLRVSDVGLQHRLNKVPQSSVPQFPWYRVCHKHTNTPLPCIKCLY